jgi:class 3 adenylate cyclase
LLGATVNATARLSAHAGAGEILVSEASAHAGDLDTTGLEHRTLELRGKNQSVDAWVVRGVRTPPPAALTVRPEKHAPDSGATDKGGS